MNRVAVFLLSLIFSAAALAESHCGTLEFNVQISPTSNIASCVLTNDSIITNGSLHEQADGLYKQVITKQEGLTLHVAQSLLGAEAVLAFHCNDGSEVPGTIVVWAHQPLCATKAGGIQAATKHGEATATTAPGSFNKPRRQGVVAWMLDSAASNQPKDDKK